jgi:hypothetical protein
MLVIIGSSNGFYALKEHPELKQLHDIEYWDRETVKNRTTCCKGVSSCACAKCRFNDNSNNARGEQVRVMVRNIFLCGNRVI